MRRTHRLAERCFSALHRRSRWALQAAAFVALWLCADPSPVQAQMIEALTAPAVSRTGERRPDSREPEAVTYADCVNDVVLTFDLNIRQLTGNDNLEVWAGSTNCATLTERRGDTARCWLVHQSTPTTEDWAAEVRTRDLAGGNVENVGFQPGQGTREDCDANVSDTSITLYFLMLGDDDEPITSTTWNQARLDLRGPGAPTGVDIGVGERSLTLSWSTTSTSDRVGVTFFCDPVDGSEAVDGGVSDCPSELQQGTLPTGAVLALECGSVGSNSTEGVARGLLDDQTYAVALASTDLVDNFGLLSEVVCGTPEAVTDFFELYRGAGGRGGGGFCGLALTASRPSQAWAAGMAALLGLLACRRRPRARRSH